MKIDGGISASSTRPAQQRPSRRPAVTTASGCRRRAAIRSPLILAAEHAERLDLATGIVVAFARNPMTLARVVGSAGGVAGPVHPRARRPDQATHHPALLDAVVEPCRPHAGDDPRHPGHLGVVEPGHQARLPGRLLQPHADDASSTRAPTPTATPDLPRRRRELMTQVAPRWPTASCATASPPGSTWTRSRSPTWPRARRRPARPWTASSWRGPCRGHRDGRGRDGRGGQGGQGPDRLLRLDASVPPVLELHGWATSRRSSTGSPRGSLGRDRRPDRRRHARDLRSDRARRSGRRALKERWGDVLDQLSFYAPSTATVPSGTRSSPSSRPPRTRTGIQDAAIPPNGAPVRGFDPPGQSDGGVDRGEATVRVGALPRRRCSLPELVLGRLTSATRTTSLAGTPTTSRARSASSQRTAVRSSSTARDSATSRAITAGVALDTKAMTLTARPPSSSPTPARRPRERGPSPPTMITSLIRPHTAGCPSSS